MFRNHGFNPAVNLLYTDKSTQKNQQQPHQPIKMVTLIHVNAARIKQALAVRISYDSEEDFELIE